MFSTKNMDRLISLILIIGTLISVLLVMLGGTLYLLQNGNESLRLELLQNTIYPRGMKSVWLTALSFSPLGMIELGLLLLVITQILRVGLLAWFYAYMRDYWFTSISVFILLMLLYSFILRN